MPRPERFQLDSLPPIVIRRAVVEPLPPAVFVARPRAESPYANAGR
ncbi:MAG: hypothetical protein ACTHNU_02810 [Gaiellales bacterium]